MPFAVSVLPPADPFDNGQNRLGINKKNVGPDQARVDLLGVIVYGAGIGNCFLAFVTNVFDLVHNFYFFSFVNNSLNAYHLSLIMPFAENFVNMFRRNFSKRKCVEALKAQVLRIGKEEMCRTFVAEPLKKDLHPADKMLE